MIFKKGDPVRVKSTGTIGILGDKNRQVSDSPPSWSFKSQNEEIFSVREDDLEFTLLPVRIQRTLDMHTSNTSHGKFQLRLNHITNNYLKHKNESQFQLELQELLAEMTEAGIAQ